MAHFPRYHRPSPVVRLQGRGYKWVMRQNAMFVLAMHGMTSSQSGHIFIMHHDIINGYLTIKITGIPNSHYLAFFFFFYFSKVRIPNEMYCWLASEGNITLRVLFLRSW